MTDTPSSNTENPNSNERSGILSEVTGMIDGALSKLQEAVVEAEESGNKNFFNILTSWISKLFDDGQSIDSMSSDQINSSFSEHVDACGVELTETQNNILGYTSQSIDFWENHKPDNVPSIPKSKLTGIHFGIFEKESNFNPAAVSGGRTHDPNAARGLAQFKPNSWRAYIERHGDLLVQEGQFTRAEIDDPNAITSNPKLSVYLTTAYIYKSISSLIRQDLLINGVNDPVLGWKIYLLHHYGSGDGPKHIRWHAAAGNPTLQNQIRDTMVNPQFVSSQRSLEHDQRTATAMQSWTSAFSGNVETVS